MESRLVDYGTSTPNYGGVARFAAVAKNLKTAGMADPGGGGKAGVLRVSSGDNYLPGPEFDASLDKGAPYYDAMAMEMIGYDAIAVGNHDFDFGTGILKSFIESFTDAPKPTFLSANLDFSADSNLSGLVTSGRIAKRVVLDVNGEKVGLVGLTTKLLPELSNMGAGTVNSDLVAAAQTEVDALEAAGINKIVLLSHLQAIVEDVALVPQLHGVDIVVAGGGHDLLANASTVLFPGDVLDPAKPYPMLVKDKTNVDTPIVTTNALYKYVGRLVATFDKDGKITAIDTSSGPVRVTADPGDADKVTPDAEVQNYVVTPVSSHISSLKANQIATTEVPLHGVKNDVRTKETNLGDLVADGMLHEAEKAGTGTVPRVVIMNGGGIRNDSVIPVGPLTEYDTFSILPFSNFVAVVHDVTPQILKQALELGVSKLPTAAGQFPQISGMWITVNPAGTARVGDADGNETTPGTRITEIGLYDWWTGTSGGVIYQNGQFSQTAPAKIDVITINFMATGGDGYPLRKNPNTILPVPYQQALRDYLQSPAAQLGLNGTVPASWYPETYTYETARIWMTTP